MNATRLTQRYVLEHPSVRDCLARGLVNYSALAREICRTYDVKSFDAVLMACRRYVRRVKGSVSNERKILELVRSAKLNIRNKIIVAIIERPRQFNKIAQVQSDIRAEQGDINVVQGEDFVTIITNADYEALIRTHLKAYIKKVTHDLAQISMLFDQRIETTPGVVSYIYGLLSQHGINVLEEMSCWTDLMFVIEEADLPKAVKALAI